LLILKFIKSVEIYISLSEYPEKNKKTVTLQMGFGETGDRSHVKKDIVSNPDR
jgi:hypothetical protein